MISQARDWASTIDAVANFELSIVSHPQMMAAFDALAMLQARSLARKGSNKLKARGLLLMGESGAGKSTLIELWGDRNPVIETPDGLVMPVVVVEVPETPTRRSLVVSIFEAMGYSASRDLTSEDVIGAIQTKVRLLGIELIILDESHHIMQSKEPEVISEFLKSLLNRLGCGIVFSGLPTLADLAKSQQFDRRLAPDVILRPYDWTNKVERVEFLLLLNQFETQTLQLAEPSNLGTQNVARRFYAATRGEIGVVCKYLSQALLIAKNRGLSKIDLKVLAEVDACFHPRIASTGEVGFDENLSEGDLAVDSVSLGSHLVEKDNNPFACAPDKLLSIFQERSTRPNAFVRSSRRNRYRAKGTGPDKLKSF